MNRKVVCTVLVSLTAVNLATAAPELTLQIVQRPPYLMLSDTGKVSGIAVEPTVAAFKRAGISVKWVELSALRQLAALKSNKESVCSVGWYKTNERLEFAKFTNPVSRDAPWVGVAHSAYKPTAHSTVSMLLADSQISVLIKNGYVHGEYLDKQFATMKARREETFSDMPQLFKMIASGRAQLLFAPEDEVQYYLKTGWIGTNEVNIISFREMPEGYNRYLMCSQQVGDDVIDRFNAALSAR